MPHVGGAAPLRVLAGALLLCGIAAAACDRDPARADLAPVDAALDRAVRYMIERQSPDGAWRSEIYGGLRDGVTLSPPILKLLHLLPESNPAARAALDIAPELAAAAREHRISWQTIV